MPTLKELSIMYAKKQPKMVDSITEEAPILDIIPFAEASHGLWNMYEEVESVTGAAFGDMDAALTTLNVTSELKKFDLSVMGGEMECGEDKAKMYGGKEKYFADRMGPVLKKSGMTSEVAILYDCLRQYCIDNSLLIDAAGTEDTCYTILAVRFEEGVTYGYYSPEGFKQGAMLHTLPINGGNVYKNSSGILVYGIRLKGYFGIQIASTYTVHAIVNIYSGKIPTEAQLDDLIANVRGTPANTFLFMHPKCKNLINGYKEEKVFMSVRDKDLNTLYDAYQSIPIVPSYNFLNGTEEAISV